MIVGGRGPKRTPALAARFADEYNVPFALAGATPRPYDRVRAGLRRARPGAGAAGLSAAQTIAVGRDDAEVRRRADGDRSDPVERLRGSACAGRRPRWSTGSAEFAAAGAARLHLQFLDLTDLDHLDLIAAVGGPAAAA